MLYDVTSTWLEGRCCPVAVEVFEGNTADPATLGAQIDKVRRRFQLSRVVLAGDRGMLTEARIHHYRPERVRAHVLLCMLAYHVEWHMRQKLAPILFDEDDPAGADATRASIAAPAEPSPSARRKAAANARPRECRSTASARSSMIWRPSPETAFSRNSPEHRPSI